MRNLLVIAVVILVLIMAGWLKYSSQEGNPTIQIDTDEVRRDTEEIVDRGKQVVDDVRREVDSE